MTRIHLSNNQINIMKAVLLPLKLNLKHRKLLNFVKSRVSWELLAAWPAQWPWVPPMV